MMKYIMIVLGLFVMPFATAMENNNPDNNDNYTFATVMENSDNYTKAMNIITCLSAILDNKPTSSFSQEEKRVAIEGLTSATRFIDRMFDLGNNTNNDTTEQND